VGGGLYLYRYVQYKIISAMSAVVYTVLYNNSEKRQQCVGAALTATKNILASLARLEGAT
jgi:hypothetical protein